jgi:excinuclease ABC subunit B
MTDSMKKAIGETDRRRAIQQAYNIENNITPQSVGRGADMSLAHVIAADYEDVPIENDGLPEFKSQEQLDAFVSKMEEDMREAAKRFEFERAAKLRDTVKELRAKEILFG